MAKCPKCKTKQRPMVRNGEYFNKCDCGLIPVTEEPLEEPKVAPVEEPEPEHDIEVVHSMEEFLNQNT